jgi:hypothetical protein
MKTAMQELIEYLESRYFEYEISSILLKSKELLADAFRNGSTSSMLGGGHWTQYYNNTYKS